MAEGIQRDFLDSQVLSRLSGLSLHARIPMLGNVSGRHRSPIRGSSLEFAEYRKYVPGDDTRRLDWRAWGRSDRFYIKEFEADTNLRLCFVVDTSGSMNFPEGGPLTKLEYAKRIAGHLAFLASHQGDAVGLYCANDSFQKEIPPKRSPAHLGIVYDELEGVEGKGATGLAAALHGAAEKISQRALIIVLSDFFVDPAELKEAFQHLRFRKHDVAAFHLLERQEVDFEFERPTRFVDLENGPAILADPELIRLRYQRAMDGYLEEISDLMRDAAIDYHRVILEEPYDEV
ncbi:MAG: DUF58 domain-containing protein, partial [Verrucomicrobiota bacterium]